ncbi:hypothetical protein [Endozoicomonas numazuensis]|uniref:Uncharacterized protein n=1 Tax=Endozoicomonas numazuensis TaxID=1137799 RepID=A0A081NJI2_9GAMM|nr:hypothetical protein [Endozoicomonas numazuensis]KEQ18605.1 hypothetical protein GZ78_00210 [Endozoicomonas numazuensis]
MTLLVKVAYSVPFLFLFLYCKNWNKYSSFIVIALLTLPLSSHASDSLLENVEKVKKYEDYFRMLGEIARNIKEYSSSNNRYWRVHILRSQKDQNEYMLIDPELSSTPAETPLGASPVPSNIPEISPFSGGTPLVTSNRFFPSWRIDSEAHSLVSGPAFQRVGPSTFKQLATGGNPFTFSANEETLLSVRMRIQNHTNAESKPKQRTFILVPNPALQALNSRKKPNKTFFCHYINSKGSTCEVCVEFETLEDKKSIHDLRTASHFYDHGNAFNNPIEQELSGADFASSLTDDDYLRFLEVFERNVQGEFLNVQDGMSIDVTEEYKTIGHAHARVIGRGQFSVVFALDNVLPGLALRRFPGYMDRKDADNFLLTHEAALTLYKELGVNLETTRLLRVKAKEGYTIYMIQRHLRKDELAETFIEGLLDYGPADIAMEIKSQGSRGEVHKMGYAEAVSRILHAVIAAIYNNLEKLGNEDCAHRICCDAKPDNFGVGFSYRKEWKRNDLYLRDVITQADLTDFHPCSLVLFDQLLFDGGPEAAMLTHILGYNPYQVYQEKIKNWADAKKLVVKSLANIAYHAGDMAHEIMPELVDRTRIMLLDKWQTNPELNRRYMEYLHQAPMQRVDTNKLPLERLFFDPDEITAESVIQYRNNSSRNNLKLKLHHYLLKLAREMRPDQFHHQLYLPVDYQQDWWLRVVDKKYRVEFTEALENRFSEMENNQLPDTEPNMTASNTLKALVDSVATNPSLVDEAKLNRLLNWHVAAGKIPDHAPESWKKHERELKKIERDHLIRRVNRFYASQLKSLHMNPWPDISFEELLETHPAGAIDIFKDSLEAFKNGFSKLQQLFWFHLVNQHRPDLPEEEQKQFDDIKKDKWIQWVNNKYSEKISTTLVKAFGQKSFEDKVPLLTNDSLLEILTREILSDQSITLFEGEVINMDEPDSVEMETDVPAHHPPHTRRKRSSTFTSQQSTHIELTRPTPDSKLLPTGYSSGTLTRKSLTELMKKWGVNPMDILRAEATTFPEAYSKLKSQNWARALDSLNLLLPFTAVYPLPETVRLRLPPRTYERQYLARELNLIPSHDKVQFPSYTNRDTVLQAIKEVMEHRNTNRESKPLVIIDLSSSVDEMISGAAYHTTPPPSPPRIIVIKSVLHRNGIGEKSQVTQQSVPVQELNQWISEHRNYDYLLRILRVHNEDQWFTLKLPEPIRTKKEKRSTPPEKDESSSSQNALLSPPAKRIKLENLPLNSLEQQELEQQGVTELSMEELTQLRANQAEAQANLQKIEQQAVRTLRQHWCQIVPVASDHFCLYNSLVHLLNMRPESAGKIIEHIIVLLKKLIQNMPYATHGLHDYVVGGLFRNIIFLALKNSAIRNHLLSQLRNMLSNTTPQLRMLLKKFLNDLQLPPHLLGQLNLDYYNILESIDHMGTDELWDIFNQMIINAENNTTLNLLLANLINQLGGVAGQAQHTQLINDLIINLEHQWHHDNHPLTPHMLFLGLGAQALNNLMNNPTQAGFQMLQDLMPLQPGHHMWGDNNVIEQLLMPLLQAANTPLNVMIVAPAIHNPQNPLGAMFIPAMAGNPALGVMPQPTDDFQQIMGWLNDPDTLTLFHGNLQTPLLPQNMMNAGTHWEPVVAPTQQPTALAPPANLAPPAPFPQLVFPTTETTGQTTEQQPKVPGSVMNGDEMDIAVEHLPPDFVNLLATLPPINNEGLQKLLKQEPDPVEASLEAFSQCIQNTLGIPCTQLEAEYWLQWLIITLTLVLSNYSSS